MKLVASMMVGPGEADRYLQPVVESLLGFCDEIVCRVEHDGTDPELLYRIPVPDARRVFAHTRAPSFYQHEGQARQELLDFTLRRDPTHVLAVDADEFVEDGPHLRQLLQHDADIWSLPMVEVWTACDTHLCERVDGAWARGSAQVWRVPPDPSGLRMADVALASGRIPVDIATTAGAHRILHTGIGMLHFGWANESERLPRYQRYVEHDNGQFHNRQHLDSIVYPPSRVQLKQRPWPTGIQRLDVLERASALR